MNEEVGASMRLLYQMKISLDRYLSKNDMTVTGLKQKTIDNKVKKVQDLSHKLPAIHKQYGVSGPTMKGTNFRNIEKKLLKYGLNLKNSPMLASGSIKRCFEKTLYLKDPVSDL